MSNKGLRSYETAEELTWTVVTTATATADEMIDQRLLGSSHDAVKTARPRIQSFDWNHKPSSSLFTLIQPAPINAFPQKIMSTVSLRGRGNSIELSFPF